MTTQPGRRDDGLLPCPFCKCTDVRLEEVVSQREWRVRCEQCGNQTCWWHHEKNARERWNCRAPSPEAAEGAYPLADLVARFSKALLAKLKLAQANGRSGWELDDWETACQQGLLRHVAKGDPRDVAAYCAFLWHHGWITAHPKPAPDAMRSAVNAFDDIIGICQRHDEQISGKIIVKAQGGIAALSAPDVTKLSIYDTLHETENLAREMDAKAAPEAILSLPVQSLR